MLKSRIRTTLDSDAEKMLFGLLSGLGRERGGRDVTNRITRRRVSELVLISNSIHRRRHATRSKKEVSGGGGGRARHVVCRIIIAPESSGGGGGGGS